MNFEEMKKDPAVMAILKSFGEQRLQFMKKEQADKVKSFKVLNLSAKKGQILFTGSSLMEQFPVTELARNYGVDKLIYNRGIGGYTTDDFIREIDTVLFDLAPSKIFINIGTNDMNPREDNIDWNQHLLENYEYILSQIKSRLPNAEVYMMAYYPVNPTVADNEFVAAMLEIRTNENIHMVNEQLRRLAGKFNFNFVDANEGLYDEAGNLRAEFTKEGIHMYANAYEVVFRNLMKHI